MKPPSGKKQRRAQQKSLLLLSLTWAIHFFHHFPQLLVLRGEAQAQHVIRRPGEIPEGIATCSELLSCLSFQSHPALSAHDPGSWCGSPNSFTGPRCLKNNTGMGVRDKRGGNTRTSCARSLPLLVQISERRREGKCQRDAGKAAQSLSRWSGVGSC